MSIVHSLYFYIKFEMFLSLVNVTLVLAMPLSASIQIRILIITCQVHNKFPYNLLDFDFELFCIDFKTQSFAAEKVEKYSAEFGYLERNNSSYCLQ